MKTRAGFVSNSSSSSYIVTINKDADLKTELTRVLSLPDGHPLAFFAKEVIGWFLSERCVTYSFLLPDEDLDEYSERVANGIREAVEDGKVLRMYKAYNDSYEGVEAWLCDNDVDYEDDRISIHGDRY